MKRITKNIFILTFMILAITYLFSPNSIIVKALEEGAQQSIEQVTGAITSSGPDTETDTEIREHRGYKIRGTASGTSYESSAGNIGFQTNDEMQKWLDEHMNNAYDESWGWYYSLLYNTSIFCQQKGQPLPGIIAKFLSRFHGGSSDTNMAHVGDTRDDYVERINANCHCTSYIKLLVEQEDSEAFKEETVYENEVDWGTEYKQTTKVRLKYTKTAKTFTQGQAYIFSYSERKTYSQDRAQLATWGYVNGHTASMNDLYRAAKALDEVCNPVKPKMEKGTDTGTILSGNNYKVGPIKMANYTFAWCKDAANYSGELLCGITEAKVKFDNGKELVLSSGNFEFTPTAQDRSGSYWRAPKASDGYFYPTPQSEFYLLIPITQAEVIGATKIESLTMTYKWTTADGDGWDLNGKYELLEWTGKETGISSCTYDCDECYHDNLSFSERSATSAGVNETSHAYYCGSTGYCFDGKSGSHRHCGGECKDCSGHKDSVNCGKSEHTHGPECYDASGTLTCTKSEHTHTDWSSASSPGCYSTKYCSYATLNYCEHGHVDGHHSNGTCDGKSWGTTHTDACYGTPGVGTECQHGHTTCYKLTWKCTKDEEVNAQKLIGVRDAQVHERTVEMRIGNIPLVAKVDINKYIYDVEHNVTYNGYDSTMSASDGRKSLDESTKESNPVYAEYGDKVTFKILLKNYSAFGVKVKVKDIIPEDSTLVLVQMGDKTLNNIDDIKNQTIAIEGGGEIWFKVVVMVESIDTTKLYNNMATIITRNGDGKANTEAGEEDIDRVRTIDDNGPVVNCESVTCNGTANEPRVTSRDYYKVNDYRLTIDKYISDYDKKMTEENNSNDFTDEEVIMTDRYEMSEEDKKNRPLQAEKTEIVTYSIRLTNDMQSIENNVSGATKKATCIRPTKITDILQIGLKYTGVTAKVYKSDNSVKYEVPVTVQDIGNNSYTFSVDNKKGNEFIILDPGEYIIYEMTVEITESNMYLYSLENYSTMTILTNINHIDDKNREVKNDQVDRNTSDQKESRDYVKLKDLVIAGRVWLDRDKDGYMGEGASGALEVGGNAINVETTPGPSSHIEDTTGKEYAMEGITVKLYDANNPQTPVRVTKTDSNGLFTFARKDNSNSEYRTPNIYSYDGSVTESDQRIPKADGKDENKNYTESSQYINYYIEYQYDGLIYKSTEIYSDNKNIGVTGEVSDKYKIDSNALEFKDIRENYNKDYEIIGFNSAYDGTIGNKKILEYEKKNHESYLLEDNSRFITARSFIKEGSNSTDVDNTKLLWLYMQDQAYNKPETEYLKYINLGLEEREDVDLSITQDVYELKTTINGEEMVYEYNQNNYTLKDGEVLPSNVNDTSTNKKEIDKEQSSTGSAEFDSERFMTGYTDDSSTLKLYQFQYYLEDYNYRISQYHTDTVRAYKGSSARDYDKAVKTDGDSVILDNTGSNITSDGTAIDSRVTGRESELNTEITFRIKVTNNAISDDEPHQEDSDKKVYTGVNEIVEYYDEDFVNIAYNADGTIKGFYIKTKDENGYLVNTELKVVSAKAYLKDNVEKDVTLSTSSPYNTARTIDGYSTLFIRPAVENTKTNTLTGNGIKAGDFILAEGESMDVLITFIVEKEAETPNVVEMETILGEKEVVAEISAYSTYYADGDNFKSASLIDKDSNPGNFGETYDGVSNVDSQDYLKYFEDDTFKTGILLKLPSTTDNSERTLTGYVWDDARSETAADDDGIQYIGDGTFDETITAIAEARKNSALQNPDENTDFKVEGVKTELIEIIKMPDPDNSNIERVYEDTIYVNGETGDEASIMKMRTLSDGTYKFKGYVPGEYIVRFTYGDKEQDEDANSLPDNRLIFNGQDYKSTSYQTQESVYAENATASGDKTAGDVRLEILEHSGNSDAKDDEIRRLEVIGYSEVMNNAKNELLKGKDSSNKEALLANTYMEAETPDFLVRTEKEIEKITTLKYQDLVDKQIPETITEARFQINNIDFGLQYRPELQVVLNKYISNITVTTSDTSGANTTEPLVDAIFDEYYGVVKNTDMVTGLTSFITDSDGNIIAVEPTDTNDEIARKVADAGGNITEADTSDDGKYELAIAGTKLNTDKSIGLENVQYLPNEYEINSDGSPEVELDSRTGKYIVKASQGFAYIVIDDSIMQGAIIKVKYLFTGTNISEVDRVSSNLSDLRFKENKETEKYAKESGADNASYYDEVVYQVSEDGKKPTFINTSYSAALTARNALFSEFYRYELDGVTIKKDLSGVNDIVYRVKAKDLLVNNKTITIPDINKAPNAGNPHSGNDGYYGRYLGSTYYTGAINSDKEVVAELKLDKVLDYIDNDLVFNNDDNKSENELWKTTTTEELYTDGMLNKSTYTYYDSTGQVVGSTTGNWEIYKLVDANGRAYDTTERSNLALSLDDRVRDDYAANEIDSTVNKLFSQFLLPRRSNSLESFGQISLTASKVLSPEDETDDMIYENVAEIIQYTTVTGRITNLATTIGNAKVEEITGESPEFHEGRTESDTASVEKVTLTPPTGLNRISSTVRNVVEGASYSVVAIIAVVAVCVGVMIGIKIYHEKKRIK